MTSQDAANLSVLFDVGGVIGSILAGLASDFTRKPATVCFVMLVAAIPMVTKVFSRN